MTHPILDDDSVERDSRPVFDITQQEPAEIADEVWQLVAARNDPDPALFMTGDGPRRLEKNPHGGALLQPLTSSRLGDSVRMVAKFVKPRAKQTPMPVGCPSDVLTSMLARVPYAMPLPVLDRIVGAPVFGRDGSLRTEPGYDPATRTLFLAANGFKLTPVRQHPTDDDVQAAREIIDDLLVDFIFADDASRANAIGFMMVPFARDLIQGQVPLYLFDKPAPGSGATLLVQVGLGPILGRPTPMGSNPNSDDEFRKRITSDLMDNPVAIVFDNVTGIINSPALMAAITMPTWTDRKLGSSETIAVAVTAIFVVTSNNASLAEDFIRRTTLIRIDTQMPHPEKRSGFKHDLPAWAYEHRPEIVWAICTIIARWLADGSKAGDAPALGSFESWTKVIGGIVAVHGQEGFETNRDQLRSNADTSQEPQRWLVEEWWRLRKELPVTLRSLYDGLNVKVNAPPGLCDGNSDEALFQSFSMRVSHMKDKVYDLEKIGIVKLVKGPETSRNQKWNLKLLEPSSDSSPSQPDGGEVDDIF